MSATSSEEDEETSPPSSSSTYLIPRPSMFPAPAPHVVSSFSIPPPSTNLHHSPSNWLHPHPSGLDQLASPAAPSHFSSFRMASEFPELFCQRVDVMSDAENIKRLLKMPYASKTPVSLVVHRVGKTLLIDNFDIHGFLLRSTDQWAWLKRFFDSYIFDSKEQRNKAMVRRSIRVEAIQQRNLESKFLYHSLEAPAALNADQGEEAEETSSANLQPSQLAQIAQVLPSLPPLPEPTNESKLPDPNSANYKFARNLLWNFEDLRMLIGSDMPIFGDAEHPSISLRLHDADKPINILTGMDYWLDNLMCQVPEVLMCYHLDGIVQNVEVVKTEDLPDMDGCQFSPKIVRDVAKNILTFLKMNAAKTGHTYWLFKAKDDDIVKLYDLTQLCNENSFKNEEEDQEEPQNPFKTAVSMLLYKVARSLRQTCKAGEEEGTIRQLLTNCLNLMDQDKFPHIATSVHFLLSDVYIPQTLNPEDPKFPDPTKESSFSVFGDPLSSQVTTATKVIDMETLKVPFHGSMPQQESVPVKPMSVDVSERCQTSLSHIVQGLDCLDLLVKRREEEQKKAKKEQEQKERDNIRLSTPNKPIPMPYDDPNKHELVPVESDGSGSSSSKLRRQRFNSESQVKHVQPVKEPAWNDHLKMLLFRKAFLVYVTSSEVHFSASRYGAALKCIKRALNCHKASRVIDPRVEDSSNKLAFAYGVAGDSYNCLVKNWEQNIVLCQEQFNGATEEDFSMAEQVERLVDEDLRDWLIKLPKDMEESLILSLKCLKKSSLLTDATDPDNYKSIHQRLGNINGELGSFYLSQIGSFVLSLDANGYDESAKQFPLKTIVDKTVLHLEEGFECFTKTKDTLNQSLLMTNLAQLHRRCGYAYQLMGDEDDLVRKEEECFRKAVDCFEMALAKLGNRRDQERAKFWDCTAWDLTTTLVCLGTNIQDNGVYSDDVHREEKKRQILGYYSKALKYCDMNSNSLKYQVRSGNIHKRLAQLHHSELNRETNSKKVAQLQRLTEIHYNKAVELFRVSGDHMSGIETSIFLAGIYTGFLNAQEQSNAKKRSKVLESSLKVFVECLPSLEGYVNERQAVDKDNQHVFGMFLEGLRKNLIEVVQFFKKKNNEKDLEWAKELYSRALKCKQGSDLPEQLRDLVKELGKYVGRVK